MSYLSETPSDRIKEKIKETGIKQAHLAKKLGISPQHLNKILTKNQEKSQYMPKMAEILGMDESWLNPSRAKSIPIVTETSLKSLADGSVPFEHMQNITFPSWASFIQEDYYFFGYKLKSNINSQLYQDDLLIFSTCLPLEITGRIGIAFIQEKNSIIIGTIKYHQNNLTIYNEYDCFNFKSGDFLLGFAINLERNIEKGALK